MATTRVREMVGTMMLGLSLAGGLLAAERQALTFRAGHDRGPATAG